MRNLNRSPAPIPAFLPSPAHGRGAGGDGHRLKIECHVLDADSINKNTETHEEKTLFTPGTISPHVQPGVINQKPDSLSTLIDPRFSSIERLNVPATPSPPPALYLSI